MLLLFFLAVQATVHRDGATRAGFVCLSLVCHVALVLEGLQQQDGLSCTRDRVVVVFILESACLLYDCAPLRDWERVVIALIT